MSAASWERGFVGDRAFLVGDNCLIGDAFLERYVGEAFMGLRDLGQYGLLVVSSIERRPSDEASSCTWRASGSWRALWCCLRARRACRCREFGRLMMGRKGI